MPKESKNGIYVNEKSKLPITKGILKRQKKEKGKRMLSENKRKEMGQFIFEIKNVREEK